MKKHTFNNYWCRLFNTYNEQYAIYQTTVWSSKKHLKRAIDNGEPAISCTISRANGTVLSTCYYDVETQTYFY